MIPCRFSIENGCNHFHLSRSVLLWRVYVHFLATDYYVHMPAQVHSLQVFLVVVLSYTKAHYSAVESLVEVNLAISLPVPQVSATQFHLPCSSLWMPRTHYSHLEPEVPTGLLR